MNKKNLHISQELKNITSHPQGIKLYNILISQIEKDLYMCGLEWNSQKALEPDQLQMELKAVINSLLKGHHKNDIRMFLYRVDVNEQMLRQTDNLTVEEIVNLVLRREIEKVWMKHKYSNL